MANNISELLNNIQIALDTCQFDKATEDILQTLNLPDLSAQDHSRLLSFLNYLPQAEPQLIFDEHIKWAKLHAPIEVAETSHSNIPDPERKLKIGYISPDFRLHSSIFFAGALICGHNRQNFEVYGYGNVAKMDQVTESIRGKFDHYRNIYGLDTESLAALIKDDKIDILVDLTGHNTGSSLAVFAKKPAPIQAAYLGYPATTGMQQIDYRLTDEIASPQEMQKYYTEQLIYLPHPFCCFDGIDLPIAPLPAQSSGYITFGCFADNLKINPQIMAVWAEILKLQNNSRLLLRFAKADEPQVRESYFQRVAEFGIERSRIEISGRLEYIKHLQQYNKVDIALDTFPFNGQTTTCEALWMGVPVISLTGKTCASRLGLCLLKAVGLESLAVQQKMNTSKRPLNLREILIYLQNFARHCGQK